MNRVKQLMAPVLIVLLMQAQTAQGAIAAAHVYHNHMPNFWPFYAVDVRPSTTPTPVGAADPLHVRRRRSST